MAVLLVTGAASEPRPAAEGAGSGLATGAAFVLREWAWTVGGTARTVTAYGPADQVDRLDPNNPTPDCPDCLLASSMSMGPGDVSGPTEVAR